MLKVDHTKRSVFDACPRKYQNQFLRHIFPQQGSTALRYGIVWHSAMEGFYSHIAENGWTRDGKAIERAVQYAQAEWVKVTDGRYWRDDYRTLENLLKSLITYVDHFAHDEGLMEVLEAEKVFMIKIVPTPEEEKLFPGLEPFYFTGRCDLEVRLSGRNWLKEFKTTGQSLDLQASRLHRSPQVIGYNYAASRILKAIPEGSLICLHHLSAYKSKKTGLYGTPKIDFKRVPQVFFEGDLREWRHHMMRAALALQSCFRADYFPMNLDSCYTYGACSYLNLCEQGKPVDKENLDGYYVDPDPWDVTREVPENEVVVIEEDTYGIQER